VRDDGAWVLNLASRTPSRVLADASAEEFAWSPDGRRVAYHSLRGGEWGIWLLDLAP
jgi:Tol biopolymer transport system component